MAEFATSIDIEAPPEIVFDHLVTVDGMLAWMGRRAELDPRPGGVFAVDIDGNPVRGEFVEVDRPRTVVVTWGLEGDDVLPAGSTKVAFRLTPTATGTRVDLTHSNLPESQVPPHTEGWAHFLGVLAESAAATAAA
ncbi:SRPBCC domain-containing protein [Nonomuraea pusilla]|uniref:SRPBCC family protein n=1 Tax=Nonomuraea pusilla TaxID=46177 RepID=UPI0033314053